MGAVALVALVVSWPMVRSVKSKWDAERDRAHAETRQRVHDYAEMHEELGMRSPFPPKHMLDEQKALARKFGANGGEPVFEGVASVFGPTFMDVEASYHGLQRCQDIVRALGTSSKDVRIFVNGKTTHRKKAWQLCGYSTNKIRVVRG
ncbi:MAG: hypothetical protein QG662_1741 [Pseudomonadota bacterium]|nr:hypothetical protein [Pseudomonadota bacterium]